jgi:hypothetical protein
MIDDAAVRPKRLDQLSGLDLDHSSRAVGARRDQQAPVVVSAAAVSGVATRFERASCFGVGRGLETRRGTTTGAARVCSSTAATPAFLLVTVDEAARSSGRTGEVGRNFHATTSASSIREATATVRTRQGVGAFRPAAQSLRATGREPPLPAVAGGEVPNRIRHALRRACSTRSGACSFPAAALIARKATDSLRCSDNCAAHLGQLCAWSSAPSAIPLSAIEVRAKSMKICSNCGQVMASAS